MPAFKTLLGFCLISFLSFISSLPHDSANLTAYEMLEKFNFPKGILPEGVESYVLNKDGSFEVYLSGDCTFRVAGEEYSLNYKRKISGKVAFGSLKELKGVTVKILFFWLSIGEVSRVGEELNFYVGLLSASFPLSNFEESPQCGRGLDFMDLVLDS
ncbi:uncharacterized protein LOC131244079 [Magnolia sinica]|uniref:uncharacterized protein LOC131244079 n=1 Tax=Magnolia sinica TaxID=86752 RepID=UPI002659C711|nr:uncharacterized protein LOC131244079 [Magnolia sinica]